MSAICSWCRREIPGNAGSHGICVTCFERLLEGQDIRPCAECGTNIIGPAWLCHPCRERLRRENEAAHGGK